MRAGEGAGDRIRHEEFPADQDDGSHDQGHGQQSDDAINENGGYSLGLLVVGFPGGVVGLDEVTSGGADHKGVEEEADEENGVDPVQAKPHALGIEDGLPADHAT